MTRLLESRLAKLEQKITPAGPEKWVDIVVDPAEGQTTEGQQALHLAEHPDDAGCSWIIRRIVRPGDLRGANDDAA